MDELQQELFKLQDLKYRDFHSKLMPGIDKETIIGIRTQITLNSISVVRLIRRRSSGSAHRYCGNLRKNLQKRKQQKLF